jgi:hypothetical protein
MPKYTVPSKEEFLDYVKKYDRRIGLRMLYQKHSIPEGERYKYRKLWKAFMEILDDASENRETTENDGNSGTPTGEAVQEEPESAENVKETVA